jgi:3-oxoacyl-[acyl-carrier protein] reductase
MRVVAVARTTSQLEDLAAQFGIIPISLDVSDADAVANAVAQVESNWGPIDLLVNNAGTSGNANATWLNSPSEWWRVFEVNVLGTYLCCRSILPTMLSRGEGRIINVASGAAHYRVDDVEDVISTAYMASKAAVIRFSETLAAEVRASGVRVFAISPGLVKTEMTSTLFADIWDVADIWSPPELTAELVEFIASGAIDELSGRYIHARTDDWRSFPGQMTKILADDLNALRITLPLKSKDQ